MSISRRRGAVPSLPEGGSLGGVGLDFQEQRFFAWGELVEIVGSADAEVVELPEGGEAGEIGGVGVAHPLRGPRTEILETRQAFEDFAAAVVDDD